MTVNENRGAATIAVQRLGDTSKRLTVDYVTGDGAAKAGINYVAAAGPLSFAPLESTKTFTIPILHDGMVTGPLAFSVALRNPTGRTALGLNTTMVTIEDTDAGFLRDGVLLKANGHVTLTAAWPFVGAYVLQLQASTNRVHWAPLSPKVGWGPTTIVFTDTDAPTFAQRFYRLKAEP